MTADPWRALAPAQLSVGLSMPDLYLRYVELGGLASQRDLAAHVLTGGVISDGEHDLAVHAINERFMELHSEERLPYEVGGLTD